MAHSYSGLKSFTYSSNSTRTYRSYTSPSPTPSISSTNSSNSRNSINRYSPYPRFKVEDPEEEEEMLRDIRDVGFRQLNMNYGYKPKARSTSPNVIPLSIQPKMNILNPGKKHLTHRRAYSMSTISYGYFLLPSRSTSSPLKTPQPLERKFQTASPIQPAIPEVDSSPQKHVAVKPNRNDTSPEISRRRLILVNPIVAAHLKLGGMVNIRSVDGHNSFKVCLPRNTSKTSIKAEVISSKKKDIGSVKMVRSMATSAC
ncbi:uncharacterized protein I206_103561 [Kwoniella pini CBS 10737]|uniref:Uncharacterized protein n=1 Tax=Kwoniella pini CBS 10737 TaxID=1296096 RepID=A0A1B9I9H2_9TREE|nr:uncharacterized protein I206_01435 [Kwoniella pini CBS 10737]OCF52150.1 hypothetical protein I206_01435 [Kwoniella pini CBS 10737]